MPQTKLALLKTLLASGDEIGALRLAARFPSLGAHQERITRAWAARINPVIYRQMGQNPTALFRDGISAIKERYGL